MLTKLRKWLNDHLGPTKMQVITEEPLVLPIRDIGPCFTGVVVHRLISDIMLITREEEEHYEDCESCRAKVKAGHARDFHIRQLVRDKHDITKRLRSR